MHVDAASGGFVVPFLHPDLEWDFRLPRVVSINVSGHKYGLTYPGIGFVVWRNTMNEDMAIGSGPRPLRDPPRNAQEPKPSELCWKKARAAP